MNDKDIAAHGLPLEMTDEAATVAASAPAITEKAKRQDQLSNVLARDMARWRTKHDHSIPAQTYTDADAAPWVDAMLNVNAKHGWRIYPNSLLCQSCDKPLDVESIEAIARAANTRRKCVAEIFKQDALRGGQDALRVLDAFKTMLDAVDEASDYFDLWEAEGAEMNGSENSLHIALINAREAGRRAMYPHLYESEGKS